jgi:CRISPR system Cascade subunit CasC
MTTPHLFLDIHVLQTVPPSNLNRDDTGSPKTAVYGGVSRARVSSQAWKRSTRVDFEQTIDRRDLGVRTKRVVEVLGNAITSAAPELAEQAEDIAAAVIKAGGIKLTAPRKGTTLESGYLLFLSNLQVAALAEAGIAAAREETLDSLDKKAIAKIIKSQNSLDVALFGRMVADVSDLNVDAAAQVAHAISVHKIDNEFDFFTAVDDQKNETNDEDAGAGMMGTVEFNSSTLYRYATINVDGLQTNMGSAEATERAVTSFLSSFVLSMPTGKQNTFANRTVPDAVVVVARKDQPISLVGAFEEAIDLTDSGSRVTAAAEKLVEHAQDITAAYGTSPLQTWTVGVGTRLSSLDTLSTRVPFTELLAGVSEYVTARLDTEAEPA